MNINFFACSVGEPGKGYDNENLERIIKYNAFVINRGITQKGPYEQISEGDVLLLKFKENFIAYGEAKGTKEINDPNQWDLSAPVNEFYFYNSEDKKEGVSITGIGDNTIKGGQMGAVKKIEEEFAIQKIKEINPNTNLLEKINKKFYMDDMVQNLEKYSSLLKENLPQLILQGPPGTGKTRFAKEIANWLVREWQVERGFKTEKTTGEEINGRKEILNKKYIQLVQFHSAYSYEDFVRGLVPQPGPDGNLVFKPQDKALLQIAKEAEEQFHGKYSDNPPPYIVIIDEINRANLPSVLGELIYALEYRGDQVNCLYPKSFDNDSKNSREITLPSNLYIIGTMNTADRSVGTLDYAIRRRFAFEHLSPNREVISNEKGKQLFNDVKEIFIGNNDQSQGHLSAEFDFNDVMIGHSYFMAEGNQLKNNLEYKIKPILREYAKDGILIDSGNQKVAEAINNL